MGHYTLLLEKQNLPFRDSQETPWGWFSKGVQSGQDKVVWIHGYMTVVIISQQQLTRQTVTEQEATMSEMLNDANTKTRN